VEKKQIQRTKNTSKREGRAGHPRIRGKRGVSDKMGGRDRGRSAWRAGGEKKTGPVCGDFRTAEEKRRGVLKGIIKGSFKWGYGEKRGGKTPGNRLLLFGNSV